MSKAVVPTVAVVLSAALVAGCSSSPSRSGSSDAAGSPAVVSPLPADVSPSAVVSSPSGVPAAVGDAGDGGNWFSALADCPDEGQEPEVQRLIQADVTGDNVKDALVARTCEASTSYLPSTVEVFDGLAGGEKPRRIATLLDEAGATDLPWYRSLKVEADLVVIQAYGVSPDGVPACPDLKLTYTYRWSGGDFERVARETAKTTDCLPVG
ncbi:hypothetical protein [Actinoplanes sp. GCM10030250]|uniref:hypothetical protein n=1 Tax=Actinoplanes sp. GCM10030250 TaxID=3273376 RepID=UPI00360A0BFB